MGIAVTAGRVKREDGDVTSIGGPEYRAEVEEGSDGYVIHSDDVDADESWADPAPAVGEAVRLLAANADQDSGERTDWKYSIERTEGTELDTSTEAVLQYLIDEDEVPTTFEITIEPPE